MTVATVSSTVAPTSSPTASLAPAPDARAQAEQARLAAADEVSAQHFAALQAQRLAYLGEQGIAQVRAAWVFAHAAHRGQWRSSGDPYITHPIAVADICAQWQLDAHALMAALLHDAMEDCGVTRAQLQERFGSTVAALVDGLTKLDKLQFNTREEGQAQSLRKMLLAAAQDVRVILIKLADRTHNMRTMGDMPRSKWARISRETLEIYAPMAHRLGLHARYRELQQLCLRHLLPWRYAVLEKAVQREAQARVRSTTRLQQQMQHALQAALGSDQLRVNVRPRSVYSVWARMKQTRSSFAKVTDALGFEILAPTALECYTALGVLHQLYKPVPGRFKDHIAIPKANGYQSLHTTLAGPAGASLHIQLRTPQMQHIAGAGIAARGAVPTDASASTPAAPIDTRWLQSLLDIQRDSLDASEFWDNVKVDLRGDAVYVFTPNSRVLELPRGASVLDFAYTIHSDVGHHASDALVNGQAAALHTVLKNGDVVQVRTHPSAQPQPEWLNFVRTGRARARIRSHLKTAAQHQATHLGEQLLAQALRAEGYAQLPAASEHALWVAVLQHSHHSSRAELLTDIGSGGTLPEWSARLIATQLNARGQRPDAVLLSLGRFTNPNAERSAAARSAFVIDASTQANVHLARCCHPVPGDPITGYLAHGQGLHVHHSHCAQLERERSRDAERIVPVQWGDGSEHARTSDASPHSPDAALGSPHHSPITAALAASVAAPSRSTAEDFAPEASTAATSHAAPTAEHLYDAPITLTLHNTRGALAQVTQEISAAAADIRRLDMDEHASSHQHSPMRMTLSVRHAQHLQDVLQRLQRLSCVRSAERTLPAS